MLNSFVLADSVKAWILSAFSITTVLLTLLNALMSPSVRELQADVGRRQQYLNESAALGRLNSQIIQALATVSAQSNDEAIRSLLARNGITFKMSATKPTNEADQQ